LLYTAECDLWNVTPLQAVHAPCLHFPHIIIIIIIIIIIVGGGVVNLPLPVSTVLETWEYS
jgi:hypothetical protein